eukprot:1161803-Pelagomonas_calceolata.AAC.2
MAAAACMARTQLCMHACVNKAWSAAGRSFCCPRHCISVPSLLHPTRHPWRWRPCKSSVRAKLCAHGIPGGGIPAEAACASDCCK